MTPVSEDTVAIGTFGSRRFKTAHSHYTGNQLSTSVCPVALTSSDAGTRLCSTGPVCQIPVPKVGGYREVDPKSCSHSSCHSRRFSRVGRCARSSLVGLSPVRRRQSGGANPAAPIRQRQSGSANPAAPIRRRQSGSASPAAPIRQRQSSSADPAASDPHPRSVTAPT